MGQRRLDVKEVVGCKVGKGACMWRVWQVKRGSNSKGVGVHAHRPSLLSCQHVWARVLRAAQMYSVCCAAQQLGSCA